jgi:AcrR family transcriptional regulator
MARLRTPASSPEHPILTAPDDPPSKREVLRAALDLFVEQGYAETSVRDIGARAGYTNPVIFKYFEGKEELAAYLFIVCYTSVADALAPAVRDDRTYAANVRALLEAFRTVVDDQLVAFLFVTENLRRFWKRTTPTLKSKAMLAIARRLFDQGKREGAVGHDADVEMLVAALAGLFSQFARMRYYGSFSDANGAWLESMERIVLAMGQ